MRKSSFLWLSIVATLVLIHVGIAQDKNQKPKRAVEKWAKEAKKRNGDKENLRINNFIMQRLDPLLKHIGENMSQHYELDETTVNNFQQHVRESVKTQLNQEKYVTGTTWDIVFRLSYVFAFGGNNTLSSALLAFKNNRLYRGTLYGDGLFRISISFDQIQVNNFGSHCGIKRSSTKSIHDGIGVELLSF